MNPREAALIEAARVPRARVSAGAFLALLLFGLLNLGASKCAPPRLPPVTPPTPPPADLHVPVCVPPGLVGECWQRPPGSPWLWNCAGGAPTVTAPSECPAAPPDTKPPDEPPTTDSCHSWEGSGPEAGLFEADVNAAIDSACAKAGVTCGLDGPLRPGTWEGFVVDVADPLIARGFVVTYDYRSGENGRASELSVKRGNRVENYQIESSAGRVRRPHGGYRSYCEPASGEGQPIRRTPVATPTPKPPAGDPSTCEAGTPEAITFKLDVRWNSAHTVAWVDATPKVNDRDWCFAHYGPDGPWPNPNALVVCPLAAECPEGVICSRPDCDRKHGTPVWFMAIDNGGAMVLVASDENDPFHLHAPLGATVKACRAADVACSEPTVLR